MRKFIALSIALVSVNALSDTWKDPDTGITWTYTVSNGKASVGDGLNYSTAVSPSTAGVLIVPSKINGYQVASVGYRAFYYCKSLRSVSLPEGVTSIGEDAFSDCYALESVNIPSTVSSIGAKAFYFCSGLTSVTIPEKITRIEQYVFYKCTGLTSVTIPASVTSLGNSAFRGCSGLPMVTIPPSVTNIEDCVFQDCSSLTTITVPDKVSVISWYAFSGCSGLKSVKMPDGITSIGDYAFYNCSGLTSLVLPLGVTKLGSNAFRDCTGLTSVIMPEGLTSIGTSSFLGCTGLTSIVIPNKTTSIGWYAFSCCTGLTAVEIPEGVKTIGKEAFFRCEGLTSVTIPSSVTSIGTSAFNGCSGLREVKFMGAPPSDVKDAALLSVNEKYYPKEHGAEWQSIIGINEFSGYSTGSTLAANVISSSIREGDPTVLDVVYKVTSKKSKVKVRVLAFEDGERSFAKVVRPETFIDGTAENVGDAVAPNVEHKISWKVSSDWATKLAKLKFEVLASEGEMLPLETMTIPASDQYGKMKITWNAISNRQAFDALLWLFADKDPGLSVTDGQVMDGEAIIAYETNASPYKKAKGAFMDEEGNYLGSECMYMAFKPATEYILEKMGYTILTGASLTYVNQETRLGLSPSGSRRYGYKIVE